MKKKLLMFSWFIGIGFITNVYAGPPIFQNLNFESAQNLTGLSPDGHPVLVPVTDAFPNWTVYEGNETMTPATIVAYNGRSLGAPAVTLVGINAAFPAHPALAGNYSATLDAGEGGNGFEPSALAQAGLIPGSDKSLMFEASGDIADNIGFLTVTFDGQNLSIFTLGPVGNYQEYGCDISALAGQTGELRFTENPGLNVFGITYLDNIVFSPLPIPEPSAWALLLCGGAVMALRPRR